MTSHELARQLLSLPDHLVLDDTGFEIKSVDIGQAGLIYHASTHEPLKFYGYQIISNNVQNEIDRKFQDSLKKIPIIHLS